MYTIIATNEHGVKLAVLVDIMPEQLAHVINVLIEIYSTGDPFSGGITSFRIVPPGVGIEQ